MVFMYPIWYFPVRMNYKTEKNLISYTRNIRNQIAGKMPVFAYSQKNTKARKPWYFWQGRQESNPRPTVLETVALPVELLPFV
jgi:hypothetical protein